uniref:RING1 and YY1 binding protein b n=1 Tax=Gasterosteus aculeatus TaxID=69293 RepID=G3PDE5_GASAC
MGDKKSPTRPKRQAKQTADDGYWDCSVCTFRNTAEAFKCSICDVRKGTSTRKPRINSQLVAQQVAQQYPMPPPPKKERRERSERTDKDRPDGEGERAIFEGPPEVEGHPEVERPEVERPEVERPEVERPEVERPELPMPERDPPEKEKSDTEQQHRQAEQREGRRRGRHQEAQQQKDQVSVHVLSSLLVSSSLMSNLSPPLHPPPRPKTDNHQSPPSEKHSIQSGKSATKTNKISHISRKNVDRSTAQQLAISVGIVTVIITDLKEKSRSSSTSSSTITSSAGSEQQHQSSGSESMDKGSSRASTPKEEFSAGHNDTI